MARGTYYDTFVVAIDVHGNTTSNGVAIGVQLGPASAKAGPDLYTTGS